MRREYWRALFLAEYYIWQALRGGRLPGGNPISGKPRAKRSDPGDYGESLAAYKAMGRYWLARATALRGVG